MIPFPKKKYEIIYADPPWQYNMGGMKGSSGGKWDCNADKHYSSLPTKNICEFPVADISADNCLLFMWIVSPMLEDALEVGRAWGFAYKQIAFVWHKDSQPVAGYYTLTQCEHCLVFKKGCIPQPRGVKNIEQFILCRRGKHSVKPLMVKDSIAKMFPTQSKIELFARPAPLFKDLSDGWDYWGNEV